MATDRLYLSDSSVREFRARVVESREDGVVLDRTAFYPTGGGQPHDTGRLETQDCDWRVTEVRGRSDIIHELDGPVPDPGTGVRGAIDWERRRAHMRYHTAQHLLSAVLLEEFDASTVGNQLYHDRARIDCEHERFTDEELTTIERSVNHHIEADRPVSWRELPREVATEQLDPSRTRIDLLPDSVEVVRIVEIAGVDTTACAGTHVSSTGDIGECSIQGRETGGRGRERIRFCLL